MQAQLGIDGGLIVESVVDDSPADGKLRQHDILLRVGDTNLGDISELIEAVQDAGENESELRLRVMREGKKIKVEVAPEKREGGDFTKVLGDQDFKFVVDGDFDFGDGVMLERFGPGLILDRETGESGDLRAEIEKLRAELDALRAKLDNRKKK